MNESKESSNIKNYDSIGDTNLNQQGRAAVMRKGITSIGIYAGIFVIVVCGIAVGLFGRMAFDPRPINYRLDGFSIDLPLAPHKDELNGTPPFSNRRISRYQVEVSDSVQYQILVMEKNDSQDKKTPTTAEYKIDAQAENSDLSQWSESTIAVLCADDDHTIRDQCLQKGSRMTRWHLKMMDGISVRGNLVRDPDGRIILMLATGASETESNNFFDSYQPIN